MNLAELEARERLLKIALQENLDKDEALQREQKQLKEERDEIREEMKEIKLTIKTQRG